jgi:hypothetical protein
MSRLASAISVRVFDMRPCAVNGIGISIGEFMWARMYPRRFCRRPSIQIDLLQVLCSRPQRSIPCQRKDCNALNGDALKSSSLNHQPKPDVWLSITHMDCSSPTSPQSPRPSPNQHAADDAHQERGFHTPIDAEQNRSPLPTGAGSGEDAQCLSFLARPYGCGWCQPDALRLI